MRIVIVQYNLFSNSGSNRPHNSVLGLIKTINFDLDFLYPYSPLCRYSEYSPLRPYSPLHQPLKFKFNYWLFTARDHFAANCKAVNFLVYMNIYIILQRETTWEFIYARRFQ